MNDFVLLLTYLLTAVGFTVLVVWPETGPSAWLRDNVVRKVLPPKMRELLDCYICCGFWSGLFFSMVWWMLFNKIWVFSGCLMVPGLFWVFLLKQEQENNS